MAKRTSVYLERKIAALHESLRFFMDPQGKGCLNERLFIFLAQIRFWDWEMESLLYSIKSFDERAKAWESVDDIEAHLRKEGLLFRHGAIDKVEKNRRDTKWFSMALEKQDKAVVAPKESIESLIDMWNLILDECEKRILRPDSEEQAEKYGMSDVMKDLSKFRR